MRALSAELQAHLDSGATTLCWCWRITRSDGVRLGFTDHDRTLSFEDTDFEGAAGLTASEARESVGLGVDNLEVEGVLSSDRLSADDLAAGLYDDARIEVFRVNWAEPGMRALIRTGSIGEVRRGTTAFVAEMRGLAHYLQQEQGRTFQHVCDATLGDARCGVVLDAPAYRGAGAVTGLEGGRLIASGLDTFTSEWFARGLLVWTAGLNAGRRVEVKAHRSSDAGAVIELWQRPLDTIAIGDTFTITAGCDKLATTCRSRFANLANFRGFPHMPGNDFVTSYPSRGDRTYDGTSFHR